MSKFKQLHACINQYGADAHEMLTHYYTPDEIKNIWGQLKPMMETGKDTTILEQKYGKEAILPAVAIWFINSARESIPPVDGAKITVSLEDMAGVALNMLHAGLVLNEAGWKPSEPWIDKGRKYSQSQRKKARNPRSIIPEIIRRLAQRLPKDSPKEIWPHLFSLLDKEFGEFGPVEEQGNQRQVNTWSYHYHDKTGKDSSVRFTYFRNIISKFRNPSS